MSYEQPVEMNERLRSWTFARLRLDGSARSLSDALRAAVAVYATHPTAPLSLAIRARSFDAARYRRLDRDRRALRIRAMRLTTFLVPTSDAARIFAAVRPPQAHVRRSFTRHGFSEKDYQAMKTKILQAASRPATARELGDVGGLRGSAQSSVLSAMRSEGLLVILAGDSLTMSPHRYVATDKWHPEGLETGHSDDARAWLAARYLRAYGPARIEDFTWWTGMAKRAARAAIETVDTIEVGDGLLLPRRDEAAFARTKRLRNSVALLPKWDAYTMGHAPDGRARFVHPDVQAKVYSPIGVGLSGDGNPVVLVDGEAVATWTYTIKDGAAVQPFERLTPTVAKKVERRLDAIATLLAG